MYSAYKLNKQDDTIQPWRTPFPIWNQSVPCPVLNVASWPAYRFLKRQVRWSGITVSFRIFCDYHKTYIKHTIVTKFTFVTISVIYKTLHFYVLLFITYFILLILKLICFTLYSLVYFIQNFLINSELEVKVISVPSLEYYLFIYIFTYLSHFKS